MHRMNPARLQFMRESIQRDEELVGSRWLEGKEVLDVGCGGGIFAEVSSGRRCHRNAYSWRSARVLPGGSEALES